MVPFLVLDCWLVFTRYREDVERQAECDAAACRAVSQHFSLLLTSLWDAEAALASGLGPGDPALNQQALQTFLETGIGPTPFIESIAWFDSSGHRLAGAEAVDGEGPAGENSGQPERCYERVLAGEDRIATEVSVCQATGRPSFGVIRALRDDGRLTGFVVARVDVALLSSGLEIEPLPAGRYGLTDPLGQVAFASGELVAVAEETPPGERPGSVVEPVSGTGWSAFVLTSLDEVQAAAWADARRTILTTVLLFPLVSVAAWYWVWRLARPVEALGHMALAIRSGDAGARLTPPPDGGLSGAGGELAAAGEVLNSMADRVAAVENDLRRSLQALSSIIQQSPLPVAAFDAHGRVTVWNRAAEETFGWGEEEVLGQSLPIVPDGEREGLAKLERQALAGSEPVSLVFRTKRKDGSRVDIRVSMAAWSGIPGKPGGHIAIYDDITERTRFLQIAAHELRNPMAGAMGGLGLLKRRLAANRPAEELTGLMNTLESEIGRLSVLLDDIIEAFRVGDGRAPFRFERVDLVAVIESVAGPFLRDEFGRRVSVSAPSRRPIAVWGDPARLGEAVRNLVGNAVKFSPPGGEVLLKLAAGYGTAWLSVSDRGIGIPPGDGQRLFEPFYRAPGLIGLDPGGLGLGLSVAREIINRHGGRLWAENRPGGGAVFRVELPLADSAEAGEPPGEGGGERETE